MEGLYADKPRSLKLIFFGNTDENLIEKNVDYKATWSS